MSRASAVQTSPRGQAQSKPSPRKSRDTNAPEQVRFSRSAWLASVLRERVIDGTYVPGQRILEAALQQEFGFSNGPIREALQVLVADGLAQRSPWQGVRVIELGQDEIVHLFELRSALLEHAAELAARRADEEAVRSAAKLREVLRRKFAAARSGQPPRVTGDTTEWVLSVAGNPYITEVWHRTMRRTMIYVYRSMRRTAGASTEPIIEELIEAILARRPAAARKAARTLTQQMLVDVGLQAATAQSTGGRR